MMLSFSFFLYYYCTTTTTTTRRVGCECTNSWEGPHCAYEKGTFYVEDPTFDLEDPKTLGLGVGLAAAVLFVGLLGFLCFRRRRETNKRNKKRERTMPAMGMGPAARPGPAARRTNGEII
jgi:hypothetical protein